MSVFAEVSAGVGYVFSSFKVLRRSGSLWVFGVTFLFCLLLMFGGVSLGSSLSGMAGEAVRNFLADSSPEWLPSWVQTAAGGLMGLIVWLASVLMMSLVGGVLILVLLSPALSTVSDRAWVLSGGTIEQTGFKALMVSIWRGVRVAVRNGLLQLFVLFLVFIIGFIPLVGVVAPVLSALVNSYFYGACFADYAMERAGLGPREASVFASRNRSFMIGLGLPYALPLFLPIIGQYIALFVAPLVAVGGACCVYRLIGQQRELDANAPVKSEAK